MSSKRQKHVCEECGWHDCWPKVTYSDQSSGKPPACIRGGE